jgi:NAD+ diphosphatase
LSAAKNEDFYFFKGNSILVPPETPEAEISEAIKAEKVSQYLDELNILDEEEGEIFSIPPLEGSKAINAVMLQKKEAPPEWKQFPLRQALNMITGGTMVEGEGAQGRLLKAFHVAQWRRDSRFCGACGSRNKDARNELARECPGCGRLEFPRICPAVITIIINERDEALLAHNKKFASGLYSLIAGFNEAGESLEATVAREIREEVGLEVRDIRYIRSQPWPFPNSLMVGFTARHASGNIKVDNIEIEDAKWFSRETLPSLPGSGSVSRYLIGLWLEGKL